jgi:hypothetical protein
MPTVEKVQGGRVYVRPLERRFTVGDRAGVDDEMAAYLCDERGDFERIEVTDAEFEPVDDTEDAGDDDEGEAGAGDNDVEELPEPSEFLAADAESFENGIETVRDAVAFDPSEQTNDEITELVQDVDNVEELDAIKELETADKNRTGALDAIDDRLDELEG